MSVGRVGWMGYRGKVGTGTTSSNKIPLLTLLTQIGNPFLDVRNKLGTQCVGVKRGGWSISSEGAGVRGCV